MKKRITKDFETRSKANLKKVGAYKYSLDPSTQPTCLAFKEHGKGMVYFLDFKAVNRPWKDQPEKLKLLWCNWIAEAYEWSAHNSFFEFCIYENILVKRYGWPAIPPRRRRCTAAKAAACALPRNLEGAGEAMKLRIQKDRRGYVAMMATCKPTRAWNEWSKLQEKLKTGARITEKSRLKAMQPEPPVFIEPNTHPEIFETLYTYCKIDVRSEEELDDSLPDLSPEEQEIWHLNQKLNWRGLRLDIPVVKKITGIMDIENKKKLTELDKLTLGLVSKPGARQSILDFLELEGITLPDIRAKTVEDNLKGFLLSDDARRLLELRKALSMTSTKKYYSFLDRAHTDSRARDILLYHGASTGRDTGTGLQPHNFPRGLISVDDQRPYAAVENVEECSHEMLNLLYGESLPIVFSALLRNMIIPSEGHELFVADFSKIEVAVLWWLADNKQGLEILESGKDPYIYMAAANTGRTYEEVETAIKNKEGWALDARQLGKAQVLGCGFGMGAKKFKTTAFDQYRVKLTIGQSKEAVKNYRDANIAVPDLWELFEEAALLAVKNPGSTVDAGKSKFHFEVTNKRKTRFLWMQLPSGRRLAYAAPQIAWRVREYEDIVEKEVNGKIVEVVVKKVTEPKETLEYWGINSKTKKWTIERTWGGTLVQGATQATARDLMMPAMVRLEKTGFKALLAVHDEGICEAPLGSHHLKKFVQCLCERPTWGLDLPVEAKGWAGPRYRK